MSDTLFTESEIIGISKKLYKSLQRMPTLLELGANGITRAMIRTQFGTKGELEACVLDELSMEYLSPPTEGVVKKLKKSQKRYVIIGIQNNTNLNKDFIKCLERYCKHNKAELLALPMYYRNPTSLDEAKRIEYTYWWDTKFKGKFVTENITLGKHLMLIPEQRITVTSMNPLDGLENLVPGKSAIFANSQFQMTVIPDAHNSHPHILHTTGSACDLSNFSKSNVGGKAQKLAINGALVVELDKDDTFHMRQLEFNEGVVCDLGKVYTPTKSMDIEEYGESTLVWGDFHAEVINPKVYEASLELAAECSVTEHVLHDVIDFTCQSHHNRNNPILRFALNKSKKDEAASAVQLVCSYLTYLLAISDKVYVIDSNHHDHLTRWMNESDWRTMTAVNAAFYVKVLDRVLSSVSLNMENLELRGGNVFRAAVELCLARDYPGTLSSAGELVFSSRNEKLLINGVDISQHGDIGMNGARGTIRGFAKAGRPMIIGHGHTPGIYRKVYQVGKSAHHTQGYTKGYSSHLNTHCIIYPNGARALINIIHGRYTLPRRSKG